MRRSWTEKVVFTASRAREGDSRILPIVSPPLDASAAARILDASAPSPRRPRRAPLGRAMLAFLTIVALGAHGVAFRGYPTRAPIADASSAGAGTQAGESHDMKRWMAIGVVAGAGLAGADARAQDAIQWRVEDGGNGHWYQLQQSGAIDWLTARDQSIADGAHLATVTSAPERLFVASYLLSIPGRGESPIRRWGPWLGAQQVGADSSSEPDGSWSWVTGEPWDFVAWEQGQPDNRCSETGEDEQYLSVRGANVTGTWNDLPLNGCDSDPVVSAVFEWSADCNADGIVDFGQIRAGELDDANGNNIPDCCEAGVSCDPCPGDADASGTVDGVDLAIILSRWGTPAKDYPAADTNGDGTVDGIDLATVLGGWGACP
jgi:hypothetical protein